MRVSVCLCACTYMCICIYKVYHRSEYTSHISADFQVYFFMGQH